MDANPQSVEYAGGFNRAQAAAIMRYYRFMKRPEFKKMGVDFDVRLYEVKEEGGVARSFEEARPRTPVLLSSPYSRLGRTIVFADTFTDEQMKILKRTLKEGNFSNYMDSVKGYRDGWFFFPTEMNIGEENSKITEIRTSYHDSERPLRTTEFQDMQVIGPQGILAGSKDQGDAKSPEVLNEYVKQIREEVDSGSKSRGDIGGNMAGYQWTSLETAGVINESPGNTVLCYGAEARPLSYAYSKLKLLYFFSAAIFVILGGILLGGHSKVLERQWESEKKRRRMMDAMAHDLKTPLGIIKNYGEVLLEEGEAQKRQQYIKTIIEEVDSMNEAVISMLDLSKMEAGTYPMELSSLSVSQLAENLAGRMEGIARDGEIRLVRDIQPTDRIVADKKLILNILSNFLSNALRHTRPGGAVELEVAQERSGVRISVKNEGSHISTEEMKKIWNSFYRGDAARKSGDGGSGLGLAIVRNACLMHGGTYGCGNEEDGVRFWARIPSLEKGLRKAELEIGPVLNVTGNGCRLKGGNMAAAGLILQGLFSFIFFEDAMTELFVSDAGYVHLWPFSAIYGGFVLLGGGLSVLGLKRIKDSAAVFRVPFRAAAISWLVLWAVESKVLHCWLSNSYSGFWQLTFLELLMLVMSVITVLLMLRACMRLAKACEDMRFYRKLRWKIAVYPLLVIAYLLMLCDVGSWNTNLFLYWVSCPAISVFAAWAWLQSCRRFEGKELRNSHN